MKCKIEVIKNLITDNGKKFSKGYDIFFRKKNENSDHINRYIGCIKKINDDSILIDNIEINRCKVNGEILIKLDEIISNSCDYVYYD